MSRCEYFFEEAAKKASQIINYDETRREAFVKGIKWCLDMLEQDVYSGHHPMASASDNAYLDKLTLKGIKKFITKMKAHRDADTETK